MLSPLLAPISEEEFFRTYWTRKFLQIPSHPGKFDHLFSWEVLNRALEEHRFEAGRLRLVRSGKLIDADRYMNGHSVNSSNLVNELSSGATLIFNSCEEVHPPLRDLCVYLEKLFHHRVSVNLYAGWRRDNGFDIHWDKQDTIILQVSGRKRWKIWNPTRLYPFKADVVDTSPLTRPGEEPVWDDLLLPGALLSIPRGWWHVAYPIDEPCLHLTVTIQNLNGIDLLHWLADHMKTSEAARMELPIVASVEERGEWLDRLFADLTATWDHTLIDRYLAQVDSAARSRPSLALPIEPDSRRNGQIEKTTMLELAVSRPLHFSGQGGAVSCRANGTAWQMDRDIAEKLKVFNDFLPHTIAELAPDSDIRLNAAIGVMLMRGVIRCSARPHV